MVVSDDEDGPISLRRGRIDGEVRDIAAIAELTRGVQARVTASHQRLRATIAKLREKSPQLFPEVFADVKGLPVSALMEIDAAFQRQGLLQGLVKKALALSAATPGGLMARRAALIFNKPDAHFAKRVAFLMSSGSGLSRLTVVERTFGIFPVES